MLLNVDTGLQRDSFANASNFLSVFTLFNIQDPGFMQYPRGMTLPHVLDDALPFLVARAGIKTSLAFSNEIKQFGLSLNEWRVCATLRYKPLQRIGEVATHTSIDTSTLSRLVDAMIERDLLIREVDPEDARARALRLTSKAEDIADRIIPLAQLYERVALAGIPAEHTRILKDCLARMYSNLDLLHLRGVEAAQKHPTALPHTPASRRKSA
jgi:DNA-binding MarR family transcriptional regulator